MTPAELINVYGPWFAMALMFFHRYVWPLVEAWLMPETAAKRAAARDAAAAALRAAEREREDRLFLALDNNTKAMTGLQGTLGHITDQLGDMTDSIRCLNEDVSGLYGHLQRPRPSRRKESAPSG